MNHGTLYFMRTNEMGLMHMWFVIDECRMDLDHTFYACPAESEMMPMALEFEAYAIMAEFNRDPILSTMTTWIEPYFMDEDGREYFNRVLFSPNDEQFAQLLEKYIVRISQ